MERLKILSEICGNPTTLEPGGLALQISPKLWLAEVFESNFIERFKEAFEPEKADKIEGLVLRKKDSALDDFGRKYYETNWIVRCRKEHKNYQY
jgi:hypothetical protein